MFGLKPKEDVFFELFVAAANNANDATIALNDMMADFNKINEFLELITKLEKKGDDIKYQIEKGLADTFITPFDREDIYLIAKKIDRYVNSILTSSLRFKMLHIDEITDNAREITVRLVKASEHLVSLVENLKSKKDYFVVKECIAKINILESEVDVLFRDAITELFYNPNDLLYVIKWKEIYQHLEDTADACEDIANTIGGVVTKNE